MAKVKQGYQLKSISRKNIDELYEEYLKETKRIVSKKFKVYGVGEKTNYERLSNQFDIYTKEQFATEVDFMVDTKTGKKLYGKKLVAAVRKLVHYEVKYTMHQNQILLNNINNIIRQIWSAAAGRSTRGRKSATVWLDGNNLSAAELGVLEIMFNNKGADLDVNSYLLTFEDVYNISSYFSQLYDYILKSLYSGDADELYKS